MDLNHLQLVTDINVEHCRLCVGVGLEALTFPKGSFKVQIQKVVFGLDTFLAIINHLFRQNEINLYCSYLNI